MPLDGEHGHEVVGGPAAAVGPDVDDQPLLAIGGGKEIALEDLKGRCAHALDVEIAQTAV